MFIRGPGFRGLTGRSEILSFALDGGNCIGHLEHAGLHKARHRSAAGGVLTQASPPGRPIGDRLRGTGSKRAAFILATFCDGLIAPARTIRARPVLNVAAANGLISPSFAGGFRRKVLTWLRGISRKFFEPAIHVAAVADPRTCEKAPTVGLGRAVGAFGPRRGSSAAPPWGGRVRHVRLWSDPRRASPDTEDRAPDPVAQHREADRPRRRQPPAGEYAGRRGPRTYEPLGHNAVHQQR